MKKYNNEELHHTNFNKSIPKMTIATIGKDMEEWKHQFLVIE